MTRSKLDFAENHPTWKHIYTEIFDKICKTIILPPLPACFLRNAPLPLFRFSTQCILICCHLWCPPVVTDLPKYHHHRVIADCFQIYCWHLLVSRLVAGKPDKSNTSQSCSNSLPGRAHLVLLLRLSTVCKKDRWAWSSSRVEQSSSSSSMMPHCTQRRRGSRCLALHTQAVARDWGNSSITKGSRWAGSVSMLVAMVNGGPNARMMSCREWSSGVDAANPLV